MNKLFLFILAIMMALPQVSAFGQEESPSKLINKIKRAGIYLYAEATSATKEEATDAAKSLLMIEVSQYVASKKKLSNADQLLMKDLKAEQQSISMARGDMIRVFLYIKKSDIEPVDNATIVQHKEIVDAAPQQEKTKLEGIVEPIESEAIKVSDASLSDWQKRLVEDIASKQNIQQVKVALNKYKAYYKVKRIGNNAQPCPTPSQAFYACFDTQGNLKALLGRDNGGQRTDYLSNTSVSLDDYLSQPIVWFTISK